MTSTAMIEFLQDHTDVAERLIGICVLNPDALDELADIEATDFDDDEVGALFEMVRDMRFSGQTVNAITISTALKTSKLNLDNAFLYRIVAKANVIELPFLADAIRQHSAAKKLRIALQNATMAAQSGTNAQHVIETLQAEIERIQTKTNDRFESSYDATVRFADEIESNHPTASITFGISDVDELHGQQHGGELLTIAARPGQGKTAYALQACQHVAELAKPVLFVSLEMRVEELVIRSLVQWGQLDPKLARYRKFSQADIAKIRSHADRLKEQKLFFWAPPTTTLSKIAAMARLCKAKHGIGFLVVDYIQLIRSVNPREDNRTRVMEVSRGLKALAKELDIPILVLAQLNRQADKEKPTLSHLAESAAIEQDSDCVMFLHESAGQSQLLVMKNRHGATGYVDLVFDKQRMLFRSQNATLEHNAPRETKSYRWPVGGAQQC